MTSLEVVPLQGLPLIRAGDDLVELLASALKLNNVTLRAGDVLVVAQKIVSKAEGRVVDLATIAPSAQAVALAADVDSAGAWERLSQPGTPDSLSTALLPRHDGGCTSAFVSCGLPAPTLSRDVQ